VKKKLFARLRDWARVRDKTVVRVPMVFHTDGDRWWTETPSMPGQTWQADTLQKLEYIVHTGMEQYFQHPVWISGSIKHHSP
jgi:hypothetical protein